MSEHDLVKEAAKLISEIEAHEHYSILIGFANRLRDALDYGKFTGEDASQEHVDLLRADMVLCIKACVMLMFRQHPHPPEIPTRPL
eukprot:5854607-Alexandrium_andersonii.AAC.1